MKSENNLKSELAKAVSVSMAKPKLSQADSIFIVKKKKELSLYEVRCVLMDRYFWVQS